ncbi:hypothetical protein AB0O76_33060 [Streptomyces sp. NPDC086554]|uniref:hypothetical protein n=1 Tax=Streptomyces sp. NPDC086554 TaxID=3154864 RepID=UPI00344233F9
MVGDSSADSGLQVLDETTVGLIFTHLSSILAMAVDDDLIAKNPCDTGSVKRVKPRRSKKAAKDVLLSWEQRPCSCDRPMERSGRIWSACGAPPPLATIAMT